MSKNCVDYYTGKPVNTPNPNVPEGAMLIGRVSYTSGEMSYDYYCLRYNPPHPEYGHWALFKVCDWKGSKPQLSNFAEIRRVGIDADGEGLE